MGRLRFGSRADLADLSHNPTLAWCQQRSLDLISSMAPLLLPLLARTRPEFITRERESVLWRKGIIKLHAKFVAGWLCWCGAPTSGQWWQLTTLRPTQDFTPGLRSLRIDHKLRLIMSCEELSTYQQLLITVVFTSACPVLSVRDKTTATLLSCIQISSFISI